MAGNNSSALGCLVVIILISIFIMFLSQADTCVVVIDHLKPGGDERANAIHKSVGTCISCGKTNVSLTDGKCTNCLFKK